MRAHPELYFAQFVVLGEGDTEELLAARVLAQEHVIYPAALAAFVTGVSVGQPSAEAALVNPLPKPVALP